MKELIFDRLPRSILFELVMAALAWPLGLLRFGPETLPLALQLIRIFLIYGGTFLVFNVLFDLFSRKQ